MSLPVFACINYKRPCNFNKNRLPANDCSFILCNSSAELLHYIKVLFVKHIDFSVEFRVREVHNYKNKNKISSFGLGVLEFLSFFKSAVKQSACEVLEEDDENNFNNV